MAEAAPAVHIGENSPEEVALKLLFIVGVTEGKSFREGNGVTYFFDGGAKRQWILDTYAECLEAVRGNRSWKQRPPVDDQNRGYSTDPFD